MQIDVLYLRQVRLPSLVCPPFKVVLYSIYAAQKDRPQTPTMNECTRPHRDWMCVHVPVTVEHSQSGPQLVSRPKKIKPGTRQKVPSPWPLSLLKSGGDQWDSGTSGTHGQRQGRGPPLKPRCTAPPERPRPFSMLLGCCGSTRTITTHPQTTSAVVMISRPPSTKQPVDSGSGAHWLGTNVNV